MNKLYEKITKYLGSTIAIGLFALWLIYHTFVQRDYISFISELAILIGLLILRAENVQAERMERSIKQTKSDTKKDLQESKDIKEMLK